MSIDTIFTDIGSGLASFIPAFFGAIYDAFIALFCTTTTAETVTTVTGFNALGTVCIAFLVIYMAYKILPVVTSFLGKKIASIKRKRARKAA